MRDSIAGDWAFGIVGAMQSTVRRAFPEDLRNWPILQSFNFEAYELPARDMVLVLKDKLGGIVTGPGVPEPFTYVGYPTLPPKIEEIELWQFYLKDKFELRQEDAAFLIPIRDSGKCNAKEDFALFSPEEKLFWNRQLAASTAPYKAYLESLEKTQLPISVTNYLAGDNSRQYINSTDTSVNIVGVDATAVFNNLRANLSSIEDAEKRERIAESIDSMESAEGSDDFKSRYK